MSNSTTRVGPKDDPVYICCGKPFAGKFMIYCEKCQEWFHGECINLKQSFSKNIKIFYCKACMLKYSLETVYTKKYKHFLQVEEKKKEETERIARCCGTCSTCLKVNENNSCRNCNFCQNGQTMLCVALRCVKQISVNRKRGRPRKEIKEKRNHPREHRDSVEEPIKQCLGINCTLAARLDSKYCSDECGKSIARARLLQLLPQKVEDFWKVMPSSEIYYREMIQRKESDILTLTAKLDGLVEMAAMLERYAKSLTKAKPDTGEGGNISNEIDVLIGCTVCGRECPSLQLLNHIYRCFVRSEKQSSFGSQVQDNESNIFCNMYNTISDTYCRRLKYLCPEHYAGELENNMKVCGCPKIWDSIKNKAFSFHEVFVSAEQLMSKRFCLAPQKQCKKHKNWLQISLSIIDNERLNYLYKLIELQNDCLIFKDGNSMHGDVITLLCSGPNGSNNSMKKESPIEA